jgi:hypothetical protein
MRIIGSLLGLILIALLTPASAADDGCEKFAWSLARERAWLAASDKMSVPSGATLSAFPKAAIAINLQPAEQVVFELPPERKPRIEKWFGGAIRFPAVERPGIYQLTLSDDAWIDIVQDGRYARSVGSTGRSDCPGLRKSLRLELGATPFTLQVSGVPSDAIVLAISPAE